MLGLYDLLAKSDDHFAHANLKLFYIQEHADSGVASDEMLRQRKNNVVIEALPAGTLGLPLVAEPTYTVAEYESLPILHLSVLILTKLNRWFSSSTSSRPKTMRKNASDSQDIVFLVLWLAEQNICINFDLYKGKTRDELLPKLRRFHDEYVERTDFIQKPRGVMLPSDWDAMMKLSGEGGSSV